MTRDEYITWASLTIDFSENAVLDKEAAKASQKFDELTAGMMVEVIVHDWKAQAEHHQEVLRRIKAIDAKSMWYFPDFYEFPHGSLDAIITVIANQEIAEEYAEILADLVVNLGAEGS